MYSNQQPPLYTTRHYIHNPQSNPTNYNAPPGPPVQSYPYYSNNSQPTTVTYVNDRSNYVQQSPPYVPPNTNRYPPPNSHSRSGSSGPAGGGGIEKTNMMSSGNPFVDPARPHEQHNTPRTVASITSQPKTGGSVNKTLNLSDENPFHNIYGGYHYPSQIDPSKRITTQASAPRSTENKSLNLSDENPFFSTYGRYHYPSQIDPSKRITEMPKAAAPLMQTNETSNDSPFNNYQPTTYREYSSGGAGGGGGGGYNSYPSANSNRDRYDNPPPPPSYRLIQPQQQQQQQPPPSSYRPSPPSPPPPPVRVQSQQPASNAPLDKTSLNMSPDNPFSSTYGHYRYPSQEEIKSQKHTQNNYNQQPSSSFRPQKPPSPPPPPSVRAQPQKPASNAPLDKTSLNMSPDNPFASTYGHYHYPSQEEIKAQKRTGERNTRFADQQPVNNNNNNNNRPQQSSNRMSEYPETESKEVVAGKGNTKYASFEVNF